MDCSQPCRYCDSTSPTRYGEFEEVIGMIILATGRTYSGWFCAKCASRIHRNTLLVNLLLGFLSGPSLFRTPVALFRNRKCYRRLKGELSGAIATPGVSILRDDISIRALPWASSIGVADDPEVSEQALTWPITTATFISLGLLIFIPVTLIPTDNRLMPFNVSLAGSIVLLCGLALCIHWHRRQRNRASSTVDVLAELFPPRAIVQTSRIQLVCFGMQSGGSYRVFVAAQNLFDQATEFRASFTSFTNAAALPHLACVLGGSEVLLAVGAIPLPRMNSATTVKIVLSASAGGSGGTQVRCVVRRALKGQTEATVNALGKVAHPHLELNLSPSKVMPGIRFAATNGKLETVLLPFESTRGGRPDSANLWQIMSLWNPQNPEGLTDAAAKINRLLNSAN